jgi:hypothetical protein
MCAGARMWGSVCVCAGVCVCACVFACACACVCVWNEIYPLHTALKTQAAPAERISGVLAIVSLQFVCVYLKVQVEFLSFDLEG